MNLTDIVDGSRLAAGGLRDFALGVFNPTVRLGITGLSRAGKTVFITALVHALLNGSKMPLFEAHARGRIARVYLEPQPDDDLPRFAYEDHLAALQGEDRKWPQSTNRISQLRLTVEYEPAGIVARNTHGGKLHIDIVDYPGEWLLDLPLMNMSYAQWSSATLAASKHPPRSAVARDWTTHLASLDAAAPSNEATAQQAAMHFTAYLARCRQDDIAMSTLPPGRFLMPGDLAGSPLLTFAPLEINADTEIKQGSLASLMERRYDAYVAKVVKPFFFGHFARLDRQIVLVDILTALNAGTTSVNDLKVAMTDVLSCFRIGANSLASEFFGRRIDRILFAATKADMIHHGCHDNLEAILRELVTSAASRAEFTGAEQHVAALSAIRATREAVVKSKGEELRCIVGTPQAGETIDGTTFDGLKEAAIFPGDLPQDPKSALDGSLRGKLKFVRFRPPPLANNAYPHIRMDRAIEFLIGDKFA